MELRNDDGHGPMDKRRTNLGLDRPHLAGDMTGCASYGRRGKARPITAAACRFVQREDGDESYTLLLVPNGDDADCCHFVDWSGLALIYM